MSHICLDLSAAIQQAAGISRYESQLATALVKLGGPEQYSLFYTSPKPLLTSIEHSVGGTNIAPEVASLPQRSIITSNKQWRLKIWLKHLARLNCDQQVFQEGLPYPRIFHGMDCIAPPLKAPSVITVYDLSFLLYPQLHSRYNQIYMRFTLPLYVRKASRILAISENTRRDLINWLGSGIADRVRVTPLGVSDESYFRDMSPEQLQAALSEYGLETRSYILTVGTIEPRKNLTKLVEAYAGLLKNWNNPEQKPPALVLVGRVGWNDEYDQVKAMADKHGLHLQENPSKSSPTRQISVLTKVNDTILKALYQGAAIACYPSLYEGFGLPALEALAAGTPLVTSNNSSLPEVTGPDGEAALLVNPTDTGQLTQALYTLLHNQNLAQKFRQAGRERARQFTWQHTAELTREVYREVYYSN